jgi:hypothetical protein
MKLFSSTSCFYAATVYNVLSGCSLYINGKIKASGAESAERILGNGGKDDKQTREQQKAYMNKAFRYKPYMDRSHYELTSTWPSVCLSQGQGATQNCRSVQ